jgi:hypothetical protein
MQWKRTTLGYSAKSGVCDANIMKDHGDWYWEVHRMRGGTKGGIRSTLKEAKSAAEHAVSHMNLLDKQ